MVYSSDEIKKIIPHRYPFLLVDKIIELDVDCGKCTGLKNVTSNEPFFQGHFPEKQVMPGVLIVEALAQVGAVMLLSKEEYKGKIALFTGIDNVKFKKQVLPGDTLILKVELIKTRGPVGIAEATAYVDEKVAATGKISFAVDIK